MNLVIVESPAKAKTIAKFLGRNFKLVASYGHVRDLPVYRFGVDIEHNFKPKYEVPKDKKSIVNVLKELADKSDEVYIATDEDREGEAIGWHIAYLIKKDETTVKRIVFHEITQSAIKEAIKHPRSINLSMVNSQEARRILDRIVGYKLSPLISKKIKNGLSAGRVQSVAVKLIVDREKEIKSFVSEEYWTIDLIFNKSIQAQLTYIDSNKLEKMSITNETYALKIKEDVKKESFRISSIVKKKVLKHPDPPFITSSMQMLSSSILGFTPKKTMRMAQNLYEGVDIDKTRMGLITYMRTDSFNVAKEAQKKSIELIEKLFGLNYMPPKPRIYKTKSKLAQEAHEAIRPVNPEFLPDMAKPYLSNDEFKLYELVWKRFIASQMSDAVVKNYGVIFESNRFKAKSNFNELEFDGYLRVWDYSKININKFPAIKKGEIAILTDIMPKQHFTEPLPRYNQASLIKSLESYGIGRPSTYATIIDTIITRGYITFEDKKFYPTKIGILVSEGLEKFFSDIINVKFTAKMEDGLDAIVESKIDKTKLLHDFYKKFQSLLIRAEQEMENKKPQPQKTNIICDVCGSEMVIKEGKFGKFLACSNYPKCKNTKSLNEEKTNIICDVCGSEMIIKHSRGGSRFLACSNYPKCKNTKPYPTGLKCPECNSNLVERSSKKGMFYGCSNYPQCKFTIKGDIKNKECQVCHYNLMVKRKDKWHCARKGCKYEEAGE